MYVLVPTEEIRKCIFFRLLRLLQAELKVSSACLFTFASIDRDRWSAGLLCDQRAGRIQPWDLLA